MSTIRFQLLNETFPHWLALKEGPMGLPANFHLKDVLACVIKNTATGVEWDKEFSGFMSDLLNCSHQHESKTKGTGECFKSFQHIKQRQDLVAPHPGTGLNHIALINHTQNQMFTGAGGRRDEVHELKVKWGAKQSRLISQQNTQNQTWEEFKVCHKKEIHPSDQQGLITKKPSELAQGAISPQQAGVNQSLAQQITRLTNQSDAIAEQHNHFNAATSVINHQQAYNTASVLTVIQIN